MKRVSKVDKLGQEYHDAVMRWGARNLVTERAYIKYEEAKVEATRKKKKK